MMLGARTAAWAKSCVSLPYKRELSFVYTPNGATGKHRWWFDTGFTYSDIFGFEINLIRLIDTSSDMVAFGSKDNMATTNSRFFVGCYKDVYYWGWNTLKIVGGISVGKQYKQGLNFRNSRMMTLDDVVVESGLATHVDMNNAVYFPIYYLKEPIISNSPSSQTKYYAFGECKMSIGDEVVADYIPVELNDGTITFYDKVARAIKNKSQYALLDLQEYIV